MKISRQENITYLALWGLLFAAPVLSLYVRTVNDAHAVFNWAEVFVVWRHYAIYLVLFLIHNFLLAPLLVNHHKRVTYFSIMAVIVTAFTVYQCNSRPEMPKRPGRPERPEMLERPERPEMSDRPDRPDLKNKPGRPPRPRADHRPADAPPPIIGERDILAVVLLILMFGANLGIKGYYRSRDDRKRLAELEHENLEQQLEYLRYQINPHFFMNTLNNIHALVDIDPEQAKENIVELSKLMRYVLYEGDKQSVPLSRELDFIQHYVTLMQLRYTDKVKISLALPQEVPDSRLPPLILVTFIENAFKHGISYQRDSFIEAKVAVEDDKLHFVCRNSKSEKPNEERGGVGLTNVRKRLDLLYANDYTLHINDAPAIYSVELQLPLKLSNCKIVK